jgi:hypothetical protein
LTSLNVSREAATALAEASKITVNCLQTHSIPPLSYGDKFACSEHAHPQFLRYQYWDDDRYAREYVPRSELRRVQRWIRRARAETSLGWGQAGLLRQILVAVERRRTSRKLRRDRACVSHEAATAHSRRRPFLPLTTFTYMPIRRHLQRLHTRATSCVCKRSRVSSVSYLLAPRAGSVPGLSAPLSGGRGGCRTSAGCRRRPPRRSPTGTRTRSPLCRRRRHAPESGIRTTTRREFPGSGRHQAHNRDSRRGRHTECPGGSPSPIYGEDQHRHSFLTPVPIIQ